MKESVCRNSSIRALRRFRLVQTFQHHGRFMAAVGGRRSICVVTFALMFLGAAVSAQEPSAAAPKNYKIEFENAYVRVFRVSHAPHDHIPVHKHPMLPTV